MRPTLRSGLMPQLSTPRSGSCRRSRSPGTSATARVLGLPRSSTARASPVSRSRAAGVFDGAVRRGVESPWERIRAIDARCSTPLGMALRGRFLVGSSRSTDLVRRFVASAAESGIDVFRIHDPLNDVAEPRRGGGGDLGTRARSWSSASCTTRARGRDRGARRAARTMASSARARAVDDPAGSLVPHARASSSSGCDDAAGLPVGLLLPGRPAGRALADALEATRVGAERSSVAAVYPIALTLHRVAGESLAKSLAGLGLDTGVDVAASLARRRDARGRGARRRADRRRCLRGIAVRAAEYDAPGRARRGARRPAARAPASDRCSTTRSEVMRIRDECGWPPLAAPIGKMIGSQALIHVLLRPSAPARS